MRAGIHIEFDFFNTCLGPRVVFGGLPGIFGQFHIAEVLYRQTAPVIRCAGGLETTFTVACVLIAEHLEPTMSVPAEQVWTEQAPAPSVEYGDRAPMNDRRPYPGMSLLQCADGSRHQSQDIRLPEAVDGKMRIVDPAKRPVRRLSRG